MGMGIPRSYSLKSNQPIPSTMMVQPAFEIYPVMNPVEIPPDFPSRVALYYTGPNTGFPTFFRPANRAMGSESDPSSGKPFGNYMLVLSPAKYNVWHAWQATAKDVRLGLLQRNPARSRARAVPFGG